MSEYQTDKEVRREVKTFSYEPCIFIQCTQRSKSKISQIWYEI